MPSLPPKPSPALLREAWIFFFVLGLVMLNYPFLVIFNRLILVLNIPLSVLYFLVGWPLSIVVIYFFSRGLSVEEEQPWDAPPRNPEAGL